MNRPTWHRGLRMLRTCTMGLLGLGFVIVQLTCWGVTPGSAAADEVTVNPAVRGFLIQGVHADGKPVWWNTVQRRPLAGMKTLTVFGEPWDLQGLEYCTQLESLTLTANSRGYGTGSNRGRSEEAALLRQLAGLTNLRELRVPGQEFHSLKDIAMLPHLATLDLSGNLISDYTPLEGMTALTELALAQRDERDQKNQARYRGEVRFRR
ncbi:MAG: hypothetical protein ABI743_13405, partial [bacterium]